MKNSVFFLKKKKELFMAVYFKFNSWSKDNYDTVLLDGMSPFISVGELKQSICKKKKIEKNNNLILTNAQTNEGIKLIFVVIIKRPYSLQFFVCLKPKISLKYYALFLKELSVVLSRPHQPRNTPKTIFCCEFLNPVNLLFFYNFYVKLNYFFFWNRVQRRYRVDTKKHKRDC